MSLHFRCNLGFISDIPAGRSTHPILLGMGVNMIHISAEFFFVVWEWFFLGKEGLENKKYLLKTSPEFMKNMKPP